MKRRQLRTAVGLFAALSIVAAACGGDDGGSSDTTSGGSDSTETTAAPSGDLEESTCEAAAAPVEGEAAMTITYDIADDANWNDGSPITWKDFEFTRASVMGTVGSLSTTGYDQVLSVEAGDSDKQVVVTFVSTYAPWKGLFGGLLQSSRFTDFPDAGEDCDVSTAFNGTIPFSGAEWIIDSWNAEQLVLVPNEAYNGPRKATNVQRVVVVPAEDGITALKAGSVDFIFPQAYTGIDAELADPNIAFESALGAAFEGFYFQMYEGPFADPIYREAFSKSIDRDAVYEQIYAPFAQGAGLLDCGPIAPGPYCDGAFDDTHDPEGAAALLEANGWTKGADGFWVNPEGEVPEVRWMVNTGNTRRESTQEFLIPLLAEAGFKVKADNCEALPCVFETRLPSLDYDMAMYINTVAPDPAYLRTYGCDQIPTEENNFQGQNSGGWCNEEATEKLKAADLEVDEATRTQLVKDVLALMAEDHVMLPLLQFPNIGARRTDKVDDTMADLANYAAIGDWYRWVDVDGDGTIVIGAEQFPTADCANPITECANSSWYVWMVSFPVLPTAFRTTPGQTYEVGEILKGEPVVVEL
jgi:peptide/nickel transport system substrate-binding protein